MTLVVVVPAGPTVQYCDGGGEHHPGGGGAGEQEPDAEASPNEPRPRMHGGMPNAAAPRDQRGASNLPKGGGDGQPRQI